ncbi:hypothetical protein DERF_011298 [Dermatophagoides farinae]|uniref:Uncharacterized protein n=1 Tax=Dermatophagoides farinae TaxID=6954 RepID=A0A922L1H7_DERFA|nr:hypothetical protein DERF_011298 [Dermatophagoides farinae]
MFIFMIRVHVVDIIWSRKKSYLLKWISLVTKKKNYHYTSYKNVNCFPNHRSLVGIDRNSKKRRNKSLKFSEF